MHTKLNHMFKKFILFSVTNLSIFYYVTHNTIHFYRAMLGIRGTSHGPVSVCPSQVGVLLKQINVGSHKQHHTIVQGL